MSDAQATLVVIEDDPQIRRFLRAGLESRGYTVFESDTARQGEIEVGTRKADLVILDLGLPDMDGVELVKRLREWSVVPIVVLSARVRENDKIDALDAGADDYLTKPFGIGELEARIRVALRHAVSVGQSGAESVFCTGELKIDLGRRQVFVGERQVHLTPIEYRLLAVLAKNAGKVLTHRQLLKDVWGPSHVEHSHYLRVYMAQLRHKLEADAARPQYLLTEAGVGYRLAAE
jgi:two-component system, OmpR family, KDP operon response regulator KdpE